MSETITLRPITDVDGPEWVRAMVTKLVAMAVKSDAGMVSGRGTSHDDEHAWVFVITAAKADGRWQAHTSWHEADGETGEAAYAVDVAEPVALVDSGGVLP